MSESEDHAMIFSDKKPKKRGCCGHRSKDGKVKKGDLKSLGVADLDDDDDDEDDDVTEAADGKRIVPRAHGSSRRWTRKAQSKLLQRQRSTMTR